MFDSHSTFISKLIGDPPILLEDIATIVRALQLLKLRIERFWRLFVVMRMGL